MNSGLSKVAACQRKSPPTWLVSTGYPAWHFFMDGVFFLISLDWPLTLTTHPSTSKLSDNSVNYTDYSLRASSLGYYGSRVGEASSLSFLGDLWRHCRGLGKKILMPYPINQRAHQFNSICSRQLWFMGYGIKISIPRPPQWRHRSPSFLSLRQSAPESLLRSCTD